MLALATHEPHFKVLREDVFSQGHNKDQFTSQMYDDKGNKIDAPKEKPFIWFHVNRLREYLTFEMKIDSPNFKYDPERGIDDWVFNLFLYFNYDSFPCFLKIL